MAILFYGYPIAIFSMQAGRILRSKIRRFSTTAKNQQKGKI